MENRGKMENAPNSGMFRENIRREDFMLKLTLFAEIYSVFREAQTLFGPVNEWLGCQLNS